MLWSGSHCDAAAATRKFMGERRASNKRRYILAGWTSELAPHSFAIGAPAPVAADVFCARRCGLAFANEAETGQAALQQHE